MQKFRYAMVQSLRCRVYAGACNSILGLCQDKSSQSTLMTGVSLSKDCWPFGDVGTENMRGLAGLGLRLGGRKASTSSPPGSGLSSGTLLLDMGLSPDVWLLHSGLG